jgi:hypothetical protein
MKGFYSRTNKNQFEKQIGKHEHCQARLRAMDHITQYTTDLATISEDLLDRDILLFMDPEEHHHMSRSKAIPLNLFKWVQINGSDPAIDICSCLSSQSFVPLR